MKNYIIGILFLLVFQVMEAHQPRLIKERVTAIEHAEISQAFYGELSGLAHYFTIQSIDSFRLFVNIMAPDMPNARTDFTVEISSIENSFQHLLDGPNFNWTTYYEEFVGDNYLVGPSYESINSDMYRGLQGEKVGPGKYLIKVYNQDLQGKYILAIGDAESWPMSEIWNAVTLLPGLKSFFEKGPMLYFTTPTTIVFLLISMAFILFFIWLMIKIMRSTFS